MSALADVLERARKGESLDQIASGVGIAPDAAAAMVDHWERVGALAVYRPACRPDADGCPGASPACAGCFFAR